MEQSSNTEEESIKQLLRHTEGNINQCAEALQIISTADVNQRPSLLRMYLIGFGLTPTDCQGSLSQVISDAQAVDLLYQVGNLSDEFLETLLDLSMTEEHFYTTLLEYITDGKIFPSLDEQAAVLYNSAIDRRLPYFEISRTNLPRIEQNEYLTCIFDIGIEVIARMYYILGAEFDQKSQQAELLIDLMDQYDRKHRIVFLSRLIYFFSNSGI